MLPIVYFMLHAAYRMLLVVCCMLLVASLFIWCICTLDRFIEVTSEDGTVERIDCVDTVLCLVDFSLPQHLPELQADLVASFQLPGITCARPTTVLKLVSCVAVCFDECGEQLLEFCGE